MASIVDFSIYTWWELAAALAVVCAAGVVRGLTGFGSGLIMVPLLAILWGPVEALGTMVVLGSISTAQLFPAAARLTNWRETAPMLVASVLLAPIGTVLLISLDKELVKKIIAALVLAMTLITMSGWKYSGPRGLLPASVAGALGGLINGIAGVGGPPLVLYLISLPDTAQTHRANIVAAMGLTSFAVLVAMATAGVIGTRVLTHTVVFLVPSLAAVWVGAWLFRMLPAELFKKIVLWFLVAISLAMLLA